MEIGKKNAGNKNVVGGFIAAFAFAACRTVVMQHPAAASVSIHDQLAAMVEKENASMPKQINEVTTLAVERVEGLKLVYVYELKNEGAVPAQANVAIGVCKSSGATQWRKA